MRRRSCHTSMVTQAMTTWRSRAHHPRFPSAKAQMTWFIDCKPLCSARYSCDSDLHPVIRRMKMTRAHLIQMKIQTTLTKSWLSLFLVAAGEVARHPMARACPCPHLFSCRGRTVLRTRSAQTRRLLLHMEAWLEAREERPHRLIFEREAPFGLCRLGAHSSRETIPTTPRITPRHGG